MVECHDLFRDEGLKRIVRVRKRGQSVRHFLKMAVKDQVLRITNKHTDCFYDNGSDMASSLKGKFLKDQSTYTLFFPAISRKTVYDAIKLHRIYNSR